MFAKIFEALYPKVFINIIVKHTSTVVYVELYSKKGSANNIHAEFETIQLDGKLLEFIQSYVRESPYYYITLLDCSNLQGALPTCSKDQLSYYYDLSNCEYKCYNGEWIYYTSKSELREIEKIYKETGVDFIFSPFVVLANFFKDNISGNLALYALVQESFISIAVFENSKLLYAEHIDMQTTSEMDGILLTNDVEDDDLELENIDESKDAKERLLDGDDILEEVDNGSFNEDYQRFSLIQTSVAHFYKDEKYESTFLENIYIADAVGVSGDLKKYLEEEMFLNVYIKETKIDAEVCKLAKEELGL